MTPSSHLIRRLCASPCLAGGRGSLALSAAGGRPYRASPGDGLRSRRANERRPLSTSKGSGSDASRNVVIVDGIRLPFALSSTIYKDEMAVDLMKLALDGLFVKTALPKKEVDYVIAGNVIQEVRTSNIAREAAINAGISPSVGSHTVAMACISASQAICTGAEKILSGRAEVVIAGGCETFSDVPIRLSRKLRQKLIELPKAQKKGLPGLWKHLSSLKAKDVFQLETPAIANYTTGEVMGVSSDRLAAKFGVGREDQDVFAKRSHDNAAAAHAEGFYRDEIVAYKGSSEENGIKGGSDPEKLAKLKPAFVRPYGTHTAANSSFLTDGAAATLIMSEEKALALDYKPLAYLREWSFRACDPFEELLLGPTYCTQDVLTKMNLQMSDIGVFEIHEAFAGQVLSNLTAMSSQAFADENFGGKRVGDVNVDRLNTRGGSLALGHPFGATGSRLVTTAGRRLQMEGERFALLAACADGGCGHACVLERYDNP